jgi:dipeptidyl aminopeptidase/acylaminoacyl peptidase
MSVVATIRFTEEKLSIVVMLIWVCSSCFPYFALAESIPLSVLDAVETREFGPYSPVGISPDGRWIAYAVVERQVSRPFDVDTWALKGVPWYAAGTEIRVVNVETGKTQRLVSERGNNWLPSWSPEGRYLAFLSDRDGDGRARLWIWDRESNRQRRASDVTVNTEKIEWAPDSGAVFLTTAPAGAKVEDYIAPRSINTPKTVTGIVNTSGSTVTLYQAASSQNSVESDAWNLNESLRDLTVVEVDSGNYVTISHGERIATFSSSPDGLRIAYTVSKRFEKPGSQQILYDIEIGSIKTHNKKEVAASDIRFDFDGASFSWSPDSLHVAFRTGGVEERTNDCYVIDVMKRTVHNISALPELQKSSPHRSLKPLWAADGDQIYFVRDGVLWRGSAEGRNATEVAEVPEHRIIQMISRSRSYLWTPGNESSTVVLTRDESIKQDGFYKIDLRSGQSTKLRETGQCHSCASQSEYVTVSQDGDHAVFFAESAKNHPDLWMSDARLESPVQVTRLNPQLAKYALGTARLVNWLSDDGDLLQGALLLPSNYQEGNRYPLITYVYGGTSLSDYVDRFGLGYPGAFNMQLLATRGYAVLLPDAPQNIGTPMLDLAKTVLPGISKVVEMGIADGHRLGVMGHSNGGYSVLALIVQTKRFSAAIEVDGMGDLFGLYGAMDQDGSAYGTSNLEHGQDALGGSPWEVRETYVENSPFFYLSRVETPILIVHGSEDNTVPTFLADQLFVGLRRLGKEVEYAKYKKEGHFPPLWSSANQIDLAERMIEWFDSHVKK